MSALTEQIIFFETATTLEAVQNMTIPEIQEIKEVFNSERAGLIEAKNTTTDGDQLKKLNDQLNSVNGYISKANKAIAMLQLNAKEKKLQEMQQSVSAQEALDFYHKAKQAMSAKQFQAIKNHK